MTSISPRAATRSSSSSTSVCDARAQPLDGARRERLAHQLAQPRVVGRVLLQHELAGPAAGRPVRRRRTRCRRPCARRTAPPSACARRRRSGVRRQTPIGVSLTGSYSRSRFRNGYGSARNAGSSGLAPSQGSSVDIRPAGVGRHGSQMPMHVAQPAARAASRAGLYGARGAAAPAAARAPACAPAARAASALLRRARRPGAHRVRRAAVDRAAAMSDPFCEVASIDYPIIDADAHVYEPPDVWQARVPARAARARAEGDAHRRGRRVVVRRRRARARRRPDGGGGRELPRLPAVGPDLRDIRRGHFDAGGAPRRHGRRRHLRAAPLPERVRGGRAHVRRRARAAARLRARLQRVAAASSAPAGRAGSSATR